MLHHQTKIALIIGLLLAIAGCTTVKMCEGAELPPEQMATLKESSHIHFSSSTHSEILQVDGKGIKGRAYVRPNEIDVLPGEYEITFTIHKLFMTLGYVGGKPRTFTIQVEAGHVYRLDGDIYWEHLDWPDYITHFWIVDETTGVEVAADRPAYEEPKPIEGPHKPF